MKVYMIIDRDAQTIECDEGVVLFASRDAADTYIETQPIVFAKDYARLKELEILDDFCGLTPGERDEHDKLRNKWGYRSNYPKYTIMEIELRE